MPVVARAQTPPGEDAARVEEARAQYREGVNAFRSRRYAEAAIAFERSYRARPHPTTLYNAAESRLRAGDREGAIQMLRDLLAMTDPAPDAQTVERARSLAREAGVEQLEPSPPPRGDCPACPECPPVRECPPPPPPRVLAPPPPILPIALLTGGAVVLATGVGFYSVALADSAVYNSPAASDATRAEVRPQGEAFRWIGLVGTIIGVGLEVTGAVLLARPPSAAPASRSSEHRQQPVTARIDIAPQGVVFSGTF